MLCRDTSRAWHTFASLCLFTFAPIACLLLLWIKTSNLDRPIRLTQCCTQFKPFGNKTFCFRNFHTFKWECKIIMEIQYTKNLNPGRFGLGTTLSYPNRSITLFGRRPNNKGSCEEDAKGMRRRKKYRFSSLSPSLLPVLPRCKNKNDGDSNKNGKKAIDLISKTTTLHVHHAFLYIFFARRCATTTWKCQNSLFVEEVITIGRFCGINCAVILRYSFALRVISDIPWSSCYESYGPKDTR